MKKYYLKRNTDIQFLNWVDLVYDELAVTKRELELYEDAKGKIQSSKLQLNQYFKNFVKSDKMGKIAIVNNCNNMSLNHDFLSISCSDMINLKPNKKIHWSN